METMSENDNKTNLKFELWGWILFVLCAGFFIASAIKNHDLLSLIGSIIFLIACLVFIVPFLTKRGNKTSSD